MNDQTPSNATINGFRYFLFGISVLLFGILNIFWSMYTDYKLNYWIAEHYYHVNLADYWLNDDPNKKGLWLLNSLYIGRTYLTIPLFIILFFLSGYTATKALFVIFDRKKMSIYIVIGLIIFWILKIPMTYQFTSIPSTEAGLFAW